MSTGQLKIHSENILPIIKKWLYSSKDIFLRELIANACDAQTKYTHICGSSDGLEISVTLDAKERCLTISDNGIGMTAEEVEKYIAQIAFSGAEEFIQKYEDSEEKDQVIGHFGLGFYSAYMVASHVEIQTLSHTEGAESACWKCDGSSTYTLEKGSRTTRGTDIILTISEGEEEALDPIHLRQILDRYCSFLPYAISFNGSRINETPPLWLKPQNECTDKEYLDFYRKLFPLDPEPLFWIHLNTDYPFNLKGILYFPRLTSERDFKKDTIKLFCNRVFVSDDCQDVLPEYLTMLRGAIDSPDIPLNVSRSSLQLDRTVKQVGQHISKKVSDRLTALYKEEKERYMTIWPDVEPIVKFGLLQDEKFYDRIKECLIWKTAKGEWTSLDDYLAGKEEKNVLYAPLEMENHEMLMMYQEKGHEVLLTNQNPLDLATINRLEEKTGAKFQRVDAKLDDTILDASKEKSVLDANGKTESAKIAQFFQSKLGLESNEVEAKSLASDKVPALLTMQEEQRRMKEQMAFQKLGAMPFKPTLVLNTNHKLINSIYQMREDKPELASSLAKHVYDLAMLSQREMAPENLNSFISRTTELLEDLTQ